MRVKTRRLPDSTRDRRLHFIVQQPQDATVAEGQTAAFSVKATASPAGVFYQWRTNGVEIPGANGPSFITSEASLADSGVIYDCVLTVPGATATSRAALLTVTNDVTAPALVSAEGNLTGTHLTLTFSEPVNVAEATNPANYTLRGPPRSPVARSRWGTRSLTGIRSTCRHP